MLCYAKSLQSYPTLCDPIDGSPPGFPVPGILQATLEWVAISFSNAWKWKEKVKSLSRVRLLATPWTAAHQAPPSMGFSRQEYWSGVPLPSPKTTIWPSNPTPRHIPCCCVASVVSDSVQPHRQQPTRLRHPWDSPGKNTGVSCHFLLQGIYPEETKIEKDTCISLFTAALFTTARTWKQPRCPLTNEWIKKLWYIHTMEYYSAIKGTHLCQF